MVQSVSLECQSYQQVRFDIFVIVRLVDSPSDRSTDHNTAIMYEPYSPASNPIIAGFLSGLASHLQSGPFSDRDCMNRA